MVLALFVGAGALIGIIQPSSYIRVLMVLELLLTAGSLTALRLNPENSRGVQGGEYLNSLTLLTLTGTEAVLGLSLLALAQLSTISQRRLLFAPPPPFFFCYT